MVYITDCVIYILACNTPYMPYIPLQRLLKGVYSQSTRRLNTINSTLCLILWC